MKDYKAVFLRLSLMWTLLVPSLCLGAVEAKDICTGDVSVHKIALDFGQPITKTCIVENHKKLEMSVWVGSNSLLLGGETTKKAEGPEVVYTNIQDLDGKKRRTTVRMTPKDRIRTEGVMADHYVGSLEVAESAKAGTEFKRLHHLEGLHFYSGTPNHEIHWGYSKNVGPANWGKIKPEWEICLTGARQSPVRLSFEAAEKTPAKPLDFAYRDVSASLVNNGHTLQVNTAEGASLVVNGKRFKLLQFHAHTPSEHVVDGKTFPMELHFVHQADDKSLAVIGVLVDSPKDAASHQRLAEILAVFPAAVNDPKEFLHKVNPEAWLPPPGSRGYFSYSGSLTTPPCTESVSWYVLRDPVLASREQIEKVRGLIGGENARHLSEGEPLPLGERVVHFSPK